MRPREARKGAGYRPSPMAALGKRPGARLAATRASGIKKRPVTEASLGGFPFWRERTTTHPALAAARAERSAPRTIDQEVFDNESAIAAMERPAAFAAHQLLVCGYRFGFDAHNLVLRAAGRTFERARTGGGHATPLIEWMRDRSNRRLRQLSLSQGQCARASDN